MSQALFTASLAHFTAASKRVQAFAVGTLPAKLAADAGIAKPRQTIETLAGTLEAEVKGDRVKVRMTDPKDLKLDGSLELDGQTLEYGYIDTGVPHAVIVVPNADRYDAFGVGRAVRHHKAFAPRGTNVNFIAYRAGSAIDARTYERGVEDLTLSSGTGSTASALVAAARIAGITHHDPGSHERLAVALGVLDLDAAHGVVGAVVHVVDRDAPALDVGRRELEAGRAMQHGLSIDGGYGGDVGRSGRA